VSGLRRHGVKDHEAYIGDRTYESLSAFADNLAVSAGQPHHYVRCAPAPAARRCAERGQRRRAAWPRPAALAGAGRTMWASSRQLHMGGSSVGADIRGALCAPADERRLAATVLKLASRTLAAVGIRLTPPGAER
jgi:hypothetical protein